MNHLEKIENIRDHSWEETISESLPEGWEVVEIMFIPGRGGKDQVHILLGSSDERQHLWFVDSDGPREVSDLPKPEMISAVSDIILMTGEGGEMETRNGHRVVFQSFVKERPGNEPDFSVLREDGKLFFRLDSGKERHVLEYDPNPDPMNVAGYAISRLNSQGFSNVNRLLGIAYWDIEPYPVPWARLFGSKRNLESAFRPFMTDLDTFIGDLMEMEPESLRRKLFLLSRKRDLESISNCRRLGRTIGEMQGSLFMEEPKRSIQRGGIGRKIADSLSVKTYSMEDVGSLLGTISSYITHTKKEMIRRYGVSPGGGRSSRRLKVVRKPSHGSDPMEVLARRFVERESHMRDMFSSLRNMAGSPAVDPLVDCRLEKMDFDGHDFILGRFDWAPPVVGEEIILPPLKDLAMVLNSLHKCRMLSVKKAMRKISSGRGIGGEGLETLFLDYNLSKGGYDVMRRDLLLPRMVGDRGSPMSSVVTLSIGSALWIELCRNGLIEGYNLGIESTGRDDLTDYPTGWDTSEGLNQIQALLALAGIISSLRDDGARDRSAGLESDLLTLLTTQA